ncbi:MAG: glyoxalase [Candidatus Methanomethylophilus sp.]|nr:glyoxalase [Methanomethylophilus sp.]MDD3233428.1 glyoxalase [Methanomethylophilus sp.]MDD4221691.1 glyoxalase [Methanomethylophilus sp.]MDD4668263.1 glyoxalase [Methanomethylophilus sp.]
MPIGDPHGAKDFEYTTEGLPESLFMAAVPVRDPLKAVVFYRDVLHMPPLYAGPEEAVVRRGSATLRLYRSDKVGINTGIYLGVYDPYAFHRRLIDEGVQFLMDPKKTPMGVVTSFFDGDRNILCVIERGAVPCKEVKDETGDRSA